MGGEHLQPLDCQPEKLPMDSLAKRDEGESNGKIIKRGINESLQSTMSNVEINRPIFPTAN